MSQGHNIYVYDSIASPFPFSVACVFDSDGHLHPQQCHTRQQQPIGGLACHLHHTPHRQDAMDRKQEATQKSQHDVQNPAHYPINAVRTRQTELKGKYIFFNTMQCICFLYINENTTHACAPKNIALSSSVGLCIHWSVNHQTIN